MTWRLPSRKRGEQGSQPGLLRSLLRGLLLTGMCAAAAVGCSKPAAPPPPPDPAVTVSHPLMRDVIEWDEYIGRLEAAETVEVRARVGGLLELVEFKDGELVKKGKSLFKLDPRPYQAEFDRTKGDVAKAESQLRFAAIEFERSNAARASQSVSEIELETKRQSKGEAEGALAAAKAAQAAAQLNLDFTEVRAPIDGRIGRRLVTPGNLINGGAGEATLLTTIASVDPIYCYVDTDEASILKYQRLAAEKTRASARDGPIPCYMNLANETGFPHVGSVDFVDNHLDPGTGTLRARGVFPNRDGLLLPGFFGRLRVPGTGQFKALLVPDSAIQTDQGQKYVLALDQANAVEYRRVTIGGLFGTLRSVSEGLKPNDTIIINGIQRARPGAKVKPEMAQIPASAFQGVSPTTQALPETRTAPTTLPATTAPASPAPGTQPAAEPATQATSIPASPASLPSPAPSTAPAAALPEQRGAQQ